MTETSSACPYKSLFGDPGTGGHTHILGVALLDVVLTFLAAWLLAWWLGANTLLGVSSSFVILLCVSVFVHMWFCVDTALVVWLKATFGSGSC